MSASLLDISTDRILRARSEESLLVGFPYHGAVGWFKQDGESEWVELRFWNRGELAAGWLTVADYVARKCELREKNIHFYRDHPSLKAEKIRLKREARGRRNGLLTKATAWGEQLEVAGVV